MSAPTAADYIAYARTMNGTCPTCGTINAVGGTPRCDCATKSGTPPAQDDAPQSREAANSGAHRRDTRGIG